MSTDQHSSKRDQLSDMEWVLSEPFQMNERNFPPSDMRGLDHDIGCNTADTAFEAEFENIRLEDVSEASGQGSHGLHSVSGNTDSTVRAPADQVYPTVGPDGASCPLTVQALELMDHQSRSHYMPGNIQHWTQGAIFPNQVQYSSNNSDSMGPYSSHKPSSYASSSWAYVAPPLQSPVNQTDEYVAGAGAGLENHSTLYVLYGPIIPDEHLRDA